MSHCCGNMPLAHVITYTYIYCTVSMHVRMHSVSPMKSRVAKPMFSGLLWVGTERKKAVIVRLNILLNQSIACNQSVYNAIIMHAAYSLGLLPLVVT